MGDMLQALVDRIGFYGTAALIVGVWAILCVLGLWFIGWAGFKVPQPPGPRPTEVRPPPGTADGVMFLLADEEGVGRLVEWRAHAGIWITVPDALASGIAITPERAAALGLRIVHSCQDLPR